MPHRLIAHLTDLFPDILLNVVSFSMLAVDLTMDVFNIIPDWTTILLVLSVAFLNVARGIAALRNGRKKNDKG